MMRLQGLACVERELIRHDKEVDTAHFLGLKSTVAAL